MTATRLLDLTAIDPALHLEGHLPECDRTERPVVGCDWCLWALDGAGVRPVLDAVRDADALVLDHDRRRGEVSVAWVVAANDLLAAQHARPEDALVPSVRQVLDRLGRVLSDRLGPLHDRLDRAVRSDGPVERRCLDTAGAVAAVALQLQEHATLVDRLPPQAGVELREVARLLSVDTQTAGLGAQVEQCHWDGLPPLRTQPAWARRPAAQRSTNARTRAPRSVAAARTTAPAAGSLEALVVESVIDTVTDALGRVGHDLADALPPTAVPRPPGRTRMSERTRALTWRIARIDWHLTFLDTGRAQWPDTDDGSATLVPWTVALAIDHGRRSGLVSATHRAEPDDDPGAGGH